jgi:hypothetical protein
MNPTEVGLLLHVTELFDHVQHFFAGDKAAAVSQLVLVDRLRQLASAWRQLIVAISELTSFDGWGQSYAAAGIAPVKKVRGD